MKRMLIAGVIFLAMTGVCVISLLMLRHERDEYIARIDEIYESAWRDEGEVTLGLIERFNADWQEEEHRISRIVRAEQLDELTAIFSRLAPLYQYGDKSEFFSELIRGRTVLDHIWLSEIPNTMNIL